MKRFVALCIVAVAFATAPAFGGWDEGLDAYDKGNYKTALRELRPLAEQGDVDAQFYLGLMYIGGDGVPQDYKQAVKWFRLSAEQGDIAGQYTMGGLYNNGQGVPQDYVLAHMWYNIAASNNAASSGAFEEDKLYEELRDSVAEKMTPAQIEKAQDLARECLAKDYKGC